MSALRCRRRPVRQTQDSYSSKGPAEEACACGAWALGAGDRVTRRVRFSGAEGAESCPTAEGAASESVTLARRVPPGELFLVPRRVRLSSMVAAAAAAPGERLTVRGGPRGCDAFLGYTARGQRIDKYDFGCPQPHNIKIIETKNTHYVL